MRWLFANPLLRRNLLVPSSERPEQVIRSHQGTVTLRWKFALEVTGVRLTLVLLLVVLYCYLWAWLRARPSQSWVEQGEGPCV